MGKDKRRVLIVGGAFTGSFCARDLKKHFNVIVVDAKEYFEYTPGILRAFVKPQHFDSLSFTLQPVYERSMGVKFIWGEVKKLDGVKLEAQIKTIYNKAEETVAFDYCIICSGCMFGPFHKWGESLWFPTIHEAALKEGSWNHIDERYYEGRRRHILEEYSYIKSLNDKKAKILVVGAGFIGVEWATELEYFFPDLDLSLIDFLPRCLGPLPDAGAVYCQDYMEHVGIKTYYNMKYDGKNPQFWKDINLPDGVDKEYICIGVKACNYFMPDDCLSKKGPGGGKWIYVNMHLQVMGKDNTEVWGGGKIYAVGDCNYGCVEGPGKTADGKPNFIINPIPKISYPGEEQALHACKYIEILDGQQYGWSKKICCCIPKPVPKKLFNTWWPWGAGMFATSLGPHDACFILAANWRPKSGIMVNWWIPAALQKEIIETSKVDECANGILGRLIWHFVHHTPLQVVGQGPLFGIEPGAVIW